MAGAREGEGDFELCQIARPRGVSLRPSNHNHLQIGGGLPAGRRMFGFSCILQLFVDYVVLKRLTVDQIAEKLQRHPELVRRWLRSGRLHGERIGWSWTVLPRDLERFRRELPIRRRR